MGRPVNTNGSALHVASFPSMLSCGLMLPFPCPVCEFLDYLEMASSQLHPNTWQILMWSCILWRHMLLNSNPEHVDLNILEFLLTYNIIRHARYICSFRAMNAFVVLEQQYCKINDWNNKFFFMAGRRWEFLSIKWAKFPIKAWWGVVPSDKTLRPTATPKELRHIAIIKKWVEKHLLAVLSKALLREENIVVHLSLISHTIHASCGISIRLPTTSARKHSPNPSIEDTGKKPRAKKARVDNKPFNNMTKLYSMWPVILIPYNLLPWLCMKEAFLMTSLIILGLKSPREWNRCVLATFGEWIERFLGQRGCYIWCLHKGNILVACCFIVEINDFPTYGNLFEWSIKEKLACPTCNLGTNSMTWSTYSWKLTYMACPKSNVNI